MVNQPRISAADLAELRARERAQEAADIAVLGAISHHTSRVQCQACPGKVARYGTTPGGARHYCRACVSRIVAANPGVVQRSTDWERKA